MLRFKSYGLVTIRIDLIYIPELSVKNITLVELIGLK